MKNKTTIENKKNDDIKVINNTKSKNNNLLIILITIVLFILIIIGLFVLYLFLNEKSDKNNNGIINEKESTLNIENTTNIQNFKDYQPKKSNQIDNDEIIKLKDVETLFPLEIFIVNLKSDNGKRYLKVEIYIEYSDKEFNAELNLKLAVIRDKIIRILTSKTLDEMYSIKGKDKLSNEIKDSLNILIGNETIKNIYFNEFIIQ